MKLTSQTAAQLHPQRGLVSLITVTIGSLVMTVLTMGMVRMMAGELQQATDAENSVRSYYAAETGAEEAVLRVKHVLLSGQPLSTLDQTDCSTDNVGGDFSATPDGTTGVTCRLIQTQAGDAIDSRTSNDAVQYDLSTVDFDTVHIEWDKKIAPNPSLATTDVPPIEVSTISYEAAGVAVPRIAYLFPVDTGGTNYVDYNLVDRDHASFQINCTQVIQYKCAVNIQNLWPTGSQGVVRIRSLYKDINYRMTVLKGGNRQVFPLQSAQIDVTAKSGDSYRRISENVPIRSNPFAGLNNAIFGDNSVCKDFEIQKFGGTETLHENQCHIAEPTNN